MAPEAFNHLTEADCRSLLASRRIGRVGLTSGGLPVILPVHYLYRDNAITFRTGAGTKQRAAESGDVIAFEVDSYDDDTGDGWSVLVLGRAVVLRAEPDEDTNLFAGRAPAKGGVDTYYVSLTCEVISGRRLVAAPVDMNGSRFERA